MMNLKVDQPLLQLIVSALAKLPYEQSAPAIQEIRRQVDAFNAEQEAAPLQGVLHPPGD